MLDPLLKKRLKYSLFGFSIALFVFLLSQTLLYYPFLKMQNSIDDGFFALRYFINKTSDSGNIVIVDMDYSSVKKLGPYKYWKGKKVADVIANLHKDGARLIFLDAVLSKGFDTKWDLALADTVYNAGNVVAGYYFQFESKSLRKRPFSSILFDTSTNRIAGKDIEKKVDLLEAENIHTSFSEFVIATAASGFTNYFPGTDKVLRHVPLYMGFGNLIVPSASLQMWLLLNNLHFTDGEILKNGVIFGKNFIPTDKHCLLRLNYGVKSGNYKKISYYDVFTGNFKKDEFRGKVVMIGSSLQSLGDIKKTPLSDKTPGVEIHAAALDTMLSGRFIRTVPGKITLLINILAGLVAGVLFRKSLSVKKALRVLLWAIGGFYFVSFIMFLAGSLLLNIAIPIFTIVLIFAVDYSYSYFEIIEKNTD